MKKSYLKNVVNEAYLKEVSFRRRPHEFVLILIDATEFEVFGIYSDEEIARRALQTMQKEEGESRFGSRYELKRVPLNQDPGHNYIPNE